MRALLACVLLLLAMSWARAEEHVLAEDTVGVGGLICDTADEVRTYVTSKGADIPSGCGELIIPMRMRVVMIDVIGDIALVRYEFLDGQLPPQFGIARKKTKGIAI